MKKRFTYIKLKVIVLKTIIVRIAHKIWGIEPFIPEPPKELPLHSLSPVGDADTDGIFGDTLYWALKHRKEKDIKNIAITGPYGSGKSSLLKTFQEKHKYDPDLKFLSISLATFKEEKDLPQTSVKDGESQKPNKTEGEDLLRLIELSILQQLFYFEDDKVIPDSRFKKIKSFSRKSIWATSLMLVMFTCALTYQINPQFILELFRVHLELATNQWLHFWTLAIVLIFGFLILFKSIRSLRSLTLKSLKLQDTAEFEISDNINKSILNHHIDEILYFFEVTRYTIVIIEDLDRFEQTEIFTKLRELNLLINRSKKIKQDIVFVYAVRDEMFRGEKERTKFFDFIIPIIPVINSSNSGEKLLSIVEQFSYPLSKELIDDVSLFIDDMRLLYNITNEYHLYSKKLTPKYPDKLFAMMVYKNLYPDDFVDLSNGKGELYRFFEEKNKLIENRIDELNLKITGCKNEIIILEGLQITNSTELRKLYLLEYISKLGDVASFKINDTVYTLSQIDKIVQNENIFAEFIQNQVKFRDSSYSTYRDISNKFDAIEKIVDTKYTYSERLKQIEDFLNNKTEILRKQISELEREKGIIKHLSLQSLLNQQSISIKLQNHKQQQLVGILLREGYIDKDYQDCISIFYEGSITKEDREFLLNVKAQLPTDFTYKLKNIDNLIKKIGLIDFEKSYILNYDLVDHLFGSVLYSQQRKALLNLLTNPIDSTFSFVNGFLDVSVNTNSFIKDLANNWHNWWNYLRTQSNLPKERIYEFLVLILEHADNKAIERISKDSDLTKFLEDESNFFSLIDNQKKLEEIVSMLKIKFKQLDFEHTNSTALAFIHEGDHYELNEYMIKGIMRTLGHFDENTFSHQNYYAIQNSNCEALQNYVNSYINNYLNRIYLALPDNKEEDKESLVDLINHEDLTPKNKTALVKFTNTKIQLLESIDELTDQALLLSQSKVFPRWDNIIVYYHSIEDVFDENLIVFLNNSNIPEELSRTKIDVSVTTKPNLETVKEFMFDLLIQDTLNDYAYEQLIKSIPWPFDRIPNLEKISFEKVGLLIEAERLNLTIDNYNTIRDNFAHLHIDLVRKNGIEFIKDISSFSLDEEDVFQLISAKEFTNANKGTIINAIDQTIITSSSRLLKKCGEYCLADSHFTIPKEIILHILVAKVLSTSQRIQLFNQNKALMSNTEIRIFIKSLPEPYSEISRLAKRPTLPNHPAVLEFVAHLKAADIIVDYSKTEKGLKISTFRKTKD